MRCVPRTLTRALRMASWVAPARPRSWPAGSLRSLAMHKSRCSVETNSSLKRMASSKACSRISLSGGAGDMPGCMLPVLGRVGRRRLASATMASGWTPHFSSTGRTMPSRSSASEMSRCSGYMTWLPFFSASTWHCCKASWAFLVNLSMRNIRVSQETAGQAPQMGEPAPNYYLYRCDVGESDPLHGGFDLDLPRFGGLLFDEGDGKHAVVVGSIDLVGIERVGYGETADEIAVAALDAMIALFVGRGGEFAFAGDGEGLVFHSHVDVLGFHVGQIGLEDEFVLGLIDVDGRCPRAVRLGLGKEPAEGAFDGAEGGERIVMAEGHVVKLLIV